MYHEKWPNRATLITVCLLYSLTRLPQFLLFQQVCFFHSHCPSTTLVLFCSIFLCFSPSLKISSIWLTPTLLLSHLSHSLSVCTFIAVGSIFYPRHQEISLPGPWGVLVVDLQGEGGFVYLILVKPQTTVASRACLMRMFLCIPEAWLSHCEFG